MESLVYCLAKYPVSLLEKEFKSYGTMLHAYANGIDDTPVITVPADAKGIGNSTTLKEDVLTRENAYQVLLGLAESVAGRLRKSEQLAGMISTEIKYHTFQSVSHQTTLTTPVNTTDTIYKTACRLFDEIWNGELYCTLRKKMQDNYLPVWCKECNWIKE